MVERENDEREGGREAEKERERGEMGFQAGGSYNHHPPPAPAPGGGGGGGHDFHMARMQRLSATNPLRLVMDSAIRVASPSPPQPPRRSHPPPQPPRPSPSPSQPPIPTPSPPPQPSPSPPPHISPPPHPPPSSQPRSTPTVMVTPQVSHKDQLFFCFWKPKHRILIAMDFFFFFCLTSNGR